MRPTRYDAAAGEEVCTTCDGTGEESLGPEGRDVCGYCGGLGSWEPGPEDAEGAALALGCIGAGIHLGIAFSLFQHERYCRECDDCGRDPDHRSLSGAWFEFYDARESA